MRAAAGAKTVGDEGKMMALTAGVRRRTPLWSSLRKHGVKTTQEFLDRADRYIKLEDAIASEGKTPNKDKGTEDPAKAANGSKPNGNGKGNGNGNGKNGGKRPHNEPSTSENKRTKGNCYEPRFTNYTALVESRAEVYQATSSSVPYKRPVAIQKDISKRDTTKYCSFHNDYRHDTNECNQLKDEIEFLIG